MHDSVPALELLEGITSDYVLADRGYDWHDVLDQIKNRLCSEIFPMLEGYDLYLEIVLKAKPSKIRFYTGLKGQLGSSFFAKSNHRKTTVFKGYPPHNLEQNKTNFERENKWQISL